MIHRTDKFTKPSDIKISIIDHKTYFLATQDLNVQLSAYTSNANMQKNICLVLRTLLEHKERKKLNLGRIDEIKNITSFLAYSYSDNDFYEIHFPYYLLVTYLDDRSRVWSDRLKMWLVQFC